MESILFSTWGAVIGLVIAIVLIVRKFQPTYSLMIGALLGGLIGGGGLQATVQAMVTGAGGMMSSVLRIMASGILAGALVKTGAAQKIAQVIVEKLGQAKALIALALATMIICSVGVFIDISVITVAPIALAIAAQTQLNKQAILIAMIGGGKAGNIISPNPNTIATAEGFSLELTSLMTVNIIPALAALCVTVLIASYLAKRPGIQVEARSLDQDSTHSDLTFLQAIAGPILVILLLALRPIAGIAIDPLIALPAGGIACLLATGQIQHISDYSQHGFNQVIGVCALLIGTGTIAGIIPNSGLQYDMIKLLEVLNLPAYVLAPLSGILMAAATASTTAGSTIASQTFAPSLLAAKVSPLHAGAMVHAGATVLDSLPHGSFFHATGGSVGLSIAERIKLIVYEATVGLTSTIVATIIYLIIT